MMRLFRMSFGFFGAALALSSAAFAQPSADSARASAVYEQIDRIFKAREYDAPRFGPARWMPDGSAYAIVEAAATPAAGREIVRYDAATGARSVLVAASVLTPPGAKTALDVADYAWSADGSRLLIFTNTRKVWRDNTRGDYWVLTVASGKLQKIGAGAPEASLMFAKFSPDASRVGYVRGNNIYIESLADGKTTALTSDGSETTINGTSDWVYEEELGVRDAFRWSPDGRRIAYWQFDSTGVGLFTLINTTDTLYPEITRIPYPKAGTTNSAVRVGVVSAEGGATTWIKTPGDPRENYIASLEWVDANTVAMQQLNRLQNRNDFLMGDAATGDVRLAFRDESKTWVDHADVRWIDGGKSFLWVSERDGWRHVYRVPREGGEARLVTKFDADVIGVAGLDEPAGLLYFTASPTDATQVYLYRAKLDGSAAPERVTPANEPGSHGYSIAPGGRLAFHTVSRFDQPPVQTVVSLPAHRSLRALTDASALTAKIAPLVKSPVEFFQVDIGSGVSIPLDGWMIKPTNFDPTKKYPVIVHVYGEPASQTVTDRWGGGRMLFHRALAEAGYLIVSFDNHGTPAPKGAEWRKKVYGRVGELSAAEQAMAVRRLAESRAYVDASRVGVWGWSGGGSNTLNTMFRHPDVFHVGVSVAPVPDQKLYDTIYQERYMSTPQLNPEGYRVGSPINFAEGLKGKLLIVHGSGDDNVHYQGTERLVNRLIELGKSFDTMVYPNRTHAISEGPGTTPHIYKLISRYFLDHLTPGPR